MAVRARPRQRAFFEDDGGFSSAGMAVALLLTLALIFSSMQVYRIQSACADVQNVADACALAAENQVASYYLVSQACDAVVLSLSITSVVCSAAGIVALCIPPAQPAGEKLLEAAAKVTNARNRFSKSVTEGLNRLQKLLPFLAAAQAARVAASNATSASSYYGVALLVPFEGSQIEPAESDAVDEFAEQAQESKDVVEQAAQEAEQAAQEADRHKLAAFMADCGSNPDHCMYERAAHLAGLSGGANPLYRSVDAWSFSVALARARAYYPARLSREAPASSAVEEIASSELRKDFYRYAIDEIAHGYVHDSPGHFDAYFPLLPKNTGEMRSTVLYTQAIYPISQDEEGRCSMHAWGGCPVVAQLGAVGYGSIAQSESEGMVVCDQCEFSASRVGKIAAATTSTGSGFEHYYRIVAEEAAAYTEARRRADEAAQRVKDPVEDLLGKLSETMASAAAARITAEPPGRVGAIAIVADTKGVPVSSLVPSSFVSDSGTLGTRAAIAGATLAQDQPDESANVISSLFDGLKERFPVAGGLPQAVARVWGRALAAYGDGHQALIDGVEQALNGLPLIGASGLGTWAAGKLRDAVSDAGFEPVELAAYKPVIVNTYHVASQDEGAFARGLVGVKDVYSHAIGSGVGNPLAVLVGAVGGQMNAGIEDLSDGFVVARIQLLGESGPSIDVRISLPESAAQGASGVVESAVAGIQGFIESREGVRRWE